jgi:glycosyltransferase involved in cell wall biosynthesis
LRIGIDLAPLVPPLTGIGNYELQLLGALMERPDTPRFLGFAGSSWFPMTIDRLPSIENAAQQGQERTAMEAKARIRRLLGQSDAIRSLYRRWRRHRFECAPTPRQLTAFHAFGYVAPGKSRVPIISVIYDVSFVRFPDMHPPERLRSLDDLQRQLESAAAVHTISKFSAQEISDVFSIEASRISVIYPGVSPIFLRTSSAADQKLLRYGLQPNRYFLAVSTLEPRKNLRSLIWAYSRLPAKYRHRRPLCVVGGRGWGALNMPSQTDALEREGSLRFLGYVRNDDLQALYANACALFYPSLYEGFGMPIIEALACGTKVICSNAASMPEAAGDVARLVSPLDVDAWSRELQHAAEETNEADMAQRRQQHAMRFSWAQSAEKTIELYRTLR